MSLEERIPLDKTRSTASLLSPLENFSEVTSQTEYRLDPLTRRVAIVGLNLSGKRTVLYSETDDDLVTSLAERTRSSCFFCPDKVETTTPRYPASILPGKEGRLRRGESLLFPNLFPLTEFHAVIALGQKHHRRLDEFPTKLLADGLTLARDFIGEVMSRRKEPIYWVVCCNYLPPGGASIIHPHIQVLGSSIPMTNHALELAGAQAYHRRHGACYFDDLVARERDMAKRVINDEGLVSWFAAFAPRGNTELQGICKDVAHLSELDESHIHGLASGLSRGLETYHGLKYSTFNFCLFAAPEGRDRESFRVFASLISRQSLVENYRCDDYFLQKMLGAEIVIDSPEQVADLARKTWGKRDE